MKKFILLALLALGLAGAAAPAKADDFGFSLSFGDRHNRFRVNSGYYPYRYYDRCYGPSYYYYRPRYSYYPRYYRPRPVIYYSAYDPCY